MLRSAFLWVFWGVLFFIGALAGSVRAQQNIYYTNGENDSTPIVITASGNPANLYIGSGTATQSGAISESGTAGRVSINGYGLNGTVVLSNSNTYSGGTTVNSGTLEVTDGTNSGNFMSNNLGSGSVAILNGATVSLDYVPTFNNNSAEYQNKFTGAGLLQVQGAGFSTAPDGTDMLTGDLSGFTGTLDLVPNSFDSTNFLLSSTAGYQPSASATIKVEDFSTLSLNTKLTYQSALQLTGNGAQGVVVGALNLEFGTTYAGSVTLESNSTIGADTTGTVSGSIGDGQKGYILTKTLDGTLTLAASNTYSGGTIVSEGVLLVANTSGSGTGSGNVTIQHGASLSGSGTISPGAGHQITVDSGGVLAPGTAANGSQAQNFLTLKSQSSTVPLLVLQTPDSAEVNMAQLTFNLGSGPAPTDASGLTFAGSSSFVALSNDYQGEVSFNNNTIQLTDLTNGNLPNGDFLLFQGGDNSDYSGLTTNADGQIVSGLTLSSSGNTDGELFMQRGDIYFEAAPEPPSYAVSLLGLVLLSLLCRSRIFRNRPAH